jgi:acyl-CoA synthetase (AMP-forming)/AMP-acid ligase II
MTALVERLRAFGDRIAVNTDVEQLSYARLAERVAKTAAALGERRRLVLIRTHNDIGTLVGYLGALAGRHVVIPVPPDRGTDALEAAYLPDAEIARDGTVVVRADPAHHLLHPDLAMVLSTSGSTGSPKLVRLSHTNLVTNAESIAQYLDITENDCAATTLPMSYCYGLSVINSHLIRGAALILTEHSVVDDQFWQLFTRHRGTSFAGVPYTFDLLDRTNFEHMELPHLRYIKQAGGRLEPQRVRRYADLGARCGWEFFVMYGATEATARMAYLPPELAHRHPGAIGQPIPGGSFTIEPLDGWSEPGVGELVYRGPNVMLGYADSRSDLAAGRSVAELRTGDIGRRNADGLYEVIGRSHRFVKLFGLRIDLQRVETVLGEHGVTSCCTSAGGALVIAATDDHDADEVRRIAAHAAGLPGDAVAVVTLPELPVLPSGKPDYTAVCEAARAAVAEHAEPTDVRRLFSEVLQVDARSIDPGSTFLTLGGTSLNYVAMSVRLERMLGRLPPNWQQLSFERIERLSQDSTPSRRRFSATLETSVALRAVAIVLIVGSHAGLFELWGGAHILLGIAGYNFGRFCLTSVPRAGRVRQLWTTIAWVAVPSIAWIAIGMAITDDYTKTNLLLANKILGPHDSMTAGRLWFIEVLVWTLIGLTVVMAVPFVDRLERRWPFGLAMVFLTVGVVLRYDLFGFHLGREAWFTFLAFWFFAAGWAAAKARHTWQRIAVTAILVVCVYGYFGDGLRESMVLGGVLLLIWLPALRCPAPLPMLAGIVAEASLYTYLTHFQVYSLLEAHPLIGVLAAIGVGVLVTWLVSALRRRLPRRAQALVRAEGSAVASILRMSPSRTVSTTTANNRGPANASSTGSDDGAATTVAPGPR